MSCFIPSLLWLWVLACPLVAQTIPPQPAPTLSRVAAGTGYAIHWDGFAGRTYFVQRSFDLKNWAYFPVLAQGSPDGHQFAFGSDAPKMFARIRHVDAVTTWDDDSDGDGLGNGFELTHSFALGLDPFLADSDGNGVADGLEDPGGDGLDNSTEQALETDPNTQDSDNDSLPDSVDAVPLDGEINWKKTPESRYVWIEQAAGFGKPLAVNRQGMILFEPDFNPGGEDQVVSHALWNSAIRNWVPLVAHGTSQTITPNVEKFIDLNDSGTIVGFSTATDEISDYPSLMWAGMVWHPSTSSPWTYDAPAYFMPDAAWNERHYHQGVQAVGGIAHDGTVNCEARYFTGGEPLWTTAWEFFNSASSGQNTQATSSIPDANEGMPGAILDQGRSLYLDQINTAPSLPFPWKLLLHDGGQTGEVPGVFTTGHAIGILGSSLNLAPSPKDNKEERLWLSVSYEERNGGGINANTLATRNAVRLEKRAGGTGADRWHTPPSMGEGASRLNARGEAILNAHYDYVAGAYTVPKLWRNGKYTDLNELAHKPAAVTIGTAIDLASTGIILATAVEDGVGKTGILLPVQMVSRDRFFAGSLRIPEGWDTLELEFVNTTTGENFGKWGDLLPDGGTGSTKIYANHTDILAEGDVVQPETQKVWFVRDENDRNVINFYTCFNDTGTIEVRLHKDGSLLGKASHELTFAQDFSDTIDYVDAWVKGDSFYLPDPTTGVTAAPTVQGQSNQQDEGLSNASRAALIPFFNVINQVEGMSSVAAGLLDGVRNGIQDDYAFVQFVIEAKVAAGDYVEQRASAELQKWKNDSLTRATELKKLADKLCEEWVFQPMRKLGEDLDTWEGFKRRSWQTWHKLRDTAKQGWTVTKQSWSGIVDAMVVWGDDFYARMIAGSEKTLWDDNPWVKVELLAEINRTTRLLSYSFGYTFGYLGEQVAVGALSGGTIKLAQVATKGGVILAGNLARRTVAAVAARGHMLKRFFAEASGKLSSEVAEAFHRGLSLAATGPTGPGLDRCAMEIMQEGVNAGRLVWREFVDDIVGKVNIGQFVKQGGEGIIERRMARLMHLLGDDFTAEIARKFLKVFDEKLIYELPDGTLADWGEDFMRAFQGSPASFVNRPPLTELSGSARQRFVSFLSDPFPGYAWKFEEEITDNWKEPIVRGILVELDLFYNGGLKKAGWTHHPVAGAIDLTDPTGVIAKQVKSLGKVNDVVKEKMETALRDLAGYSQNSSRSQLFLEMHYKPDLAPDVAILKGQMDDYIKTPEIQNILRPGVSIEINTLPYEFIPKF